MVAVQQLTLDDLRPAPVEPAPAPVYLGSMGALCLLTDYLCWERWGYWSECGGPPSFASDGLTKAKRAAQLAQPADVRWSLEGRQAGDSFQGTFRVWDEANPWAEPWSVNFRYSSEESARRQFAAEFEKHSGWQEDAVRVLIYYREHGELPEDGGKPEGQRYWLKPGFDPSKRVHLKEGQPGVICSEVIQAASEHDRHGRLHVEIEPHRPDDWMADCFAETPGPGQTVKAAHLHGKNYEEASALGRQWLEEVGRPHVTSAPIAAIRED